MSVAMSAADKIIPGITCTVAGAIVSDSACSLAIRTLAAYVHERF